MKKLSMLFKLIPLVLLVFSLNLGCAQPAGGPAGVDQVPGTPIPADPGSGSPDSSASDPVIPDDFTGIIAAAADLAKIGNDPQYPRNGAYTLTADITLSNWDTICADSANPFRGSFDGGGHTITITGFSSASLADAYVGIFGYVKGTNASGVKIKNLKIVSSVDNTTARPTGQAIGLLAGYAEYAEIENIHTSGTFNYRSSKAVINIGGTVGWLQRASIKSCANSMTMYIVGGYLDPIDPNIVVYSAVGSFVGLFRYSSEIADCRNSGAITGRGIGSVPRGGNYTGGAEHAQVYVGGIAGSGHFAFETDNSGSIVNCTNTGDITAYATGFWALAAGISNSSGYIDRCTAKGRISAKTLVNPYAYAGGINAYAIGDFSITNNHFGGKIINNATYYAKGPIDGHTGYIMSAAVNNTAGSDSFNNTWDVWLE
jgi:hypothetical protein